MATSVEVDRVLEVQLPHDITLGSGSGLRCERSVEIIDIGLVMLGMMEGHNLSTDCWLKGLDESKFHSPIARGRGVKRHTSYA